MMRAIVRATRVQVGRVMRGQGVPLMMVLVVLLIQVPAVHVILVRAEMNMLALVALLMMVRVDRDTPVLVEMRTLVLMDLLILAQAGHAMTVLVGLVIQDLVEEINVLRSASNQSYRVRLRPISIDDLKLDI